MVAGKTYHTVFDDNWYTWYDKNEIPADTTTGGDFPDYIHDNDICPGTNEQYTRANCPPAPDCSNVKQKWGEGKLCINRVPLPFDKTIFYIAAMKCIPKWENCDKCVCGLLDYQTGLCGHFHPGHAPDDDRQQVDCNNLERISYKAVEIGRNIEFEPYEPRTTQSPTTSSSPSMVPSNQPSSSPSSTPTISGSSEPSTQPSQSRSSTPTVSSEPSTQPSSSPSSKPTVKGSSKPSYQPSSIPSSKPTVTGSSEPSYQPSSIPSSKPTVTGSSPPSSFPSTLPTLSDSPSLTPSFSNEPTFISKKTVFIEPLSSNVAARSVVAGFVAFGTTGIVVFVLGVMYVRRQNRRTLADSHVLFTDNESVSAA